MIRDAKQLGTMLQEIRTFLRTECLPIEAQVDAADEIPEPVVQRMRELGLFGHSIPEEYGGAGLTTEELALVNIEVSQVATTFRARFGGNTGIASESLVVDGTPEQKRRYLPLLASGEVTGCFALTEPDAGSDATALRTTAVRDGDHYVITGASASSPTRPLPTCSRCSRAPILSPRARGRHGLPGGAGCARPEHAAGLSQDGPARIARGRGGAGPGARA
ncbi:acyl-CoA dehydrogenase, short-chain specific [Alicycliphilus sp. B1]|nr:acyl-CoA dehydrogenase, short-chain specific [Alicycliphilus sp. B1]